MLGPLSGLAFLANLKGALPLRNANQTAGGVLVRADSTTEVESTPAMFDTRCAAIFLFIVD